MSLAPALPACLPAVVSANLARRRLLEMALALKKPNIFAMLGMDGITRVLANDLVQSGQKARAF